MRNLCFLPQGPLLPKIQEEISAACHSVSSEDQRPDRFPRRSPEDIHVQYHLKQFSEFTRAGGIQSSFVEVHEMFSDLV